MICHGELVRRKPSPQFLTEFYLMCSAGGALGGVLVAIVCPLVFSTYVELHAGLIAAYGLAFAVLVCEERFLAWPRRSRAAAVGIAVLAVGMIGVTRVQLSSLHPGRLAAMRSFYGVLYVDEVDQADPARHGRVMFHGRIAHGFQFQSPELRRKPTMYFDEKSGVGVTLANMRRDTLGSPKPLRVGVIGLGVGVIAAYAEKGDTFRFYEINPDSETIARKYFSFLADSPGEVQVVLGDARRSMEVEPPQGFDVLVLDAFSGDAIPTHLLTREALAVYDRHLAPGGVIAAHISNRHVDLVPVLGNLARVFDWKTLEVRTQTDTERAATASQWVLLTRNEAFLANPTVQTATAKLDEYAAIPLWTDEYSNLLQLLK
jgi:hypothetical protein